MSRCTKTRSRDEFPRQTDTFARAPAMLSAEALGTIVELVPPDPNARCPVGQARPR